MAIHNFGLSSEVTGGRVINTSSNSTIGNIVDSLSSGKTYFDTPRQAFDFISEVSPSLETRNDLEFYLGVLYVVGEFLNGNESYDINNIDQYYHPQNGVKSVRNRKGIISKQVLQVLENGKNSIEITDVDFKGLSQAITNFVVNTNPVDDRRKLQKIKNMLLNNLGLSENDDWTIIIKSIENLMVKTGNESESQKKAA